MTRAHIPPVALPHFFGQSGLLIVRRFQHKIAPLVFNNIENVRHRSPSSLYPRSLPF